MFNFGLICFITSCIFLSVNSENTWTGDPQFGLQNCYYSPEGTMELSGHSFSIPTVILEELTNLLESYGFTSNGYSSIISIYSGDMSCYNQYIALSSTNGDTSAYEALYAGTNDLSLYSISEELTQACIDGYDNITNDFQVLSIGQYFLCDLEDSIYCTTGEFHENIELFTQQSQLYETIVNDNIDNSYASDTTVDLYLGFLITFDSSDDDAVTWCDSTYSSSYFREEIWEWLAPRGSQGGFSSSPSCSEGVVAVSLSPDWDSVTNFFDDYFDHGNFSFEYIVDNLADNIYQFPSSGVVNGDLYYGSIFCDNADPCDLIQLYQDGYDGSQSILAPVYSDTTEEDGNIDEDDSDNEDDEDDTGNDDSTTSGGDDSTTSGGDVSSTSGGNCVGLTLTFGYYCLYFGFMCVVCVLYV